jgi:hypothetical protein
MGSPNQSADPVSSFVVRVVRGWNHFWFAPRDPTALGFIRLCCGLTVFYIYLAYSFDLQTFFGERAWIDQATMENFRHNSLVFPTVTEWEDPEPMRASNAEEQAEIEMWGGLKARAWSVGQYRWSVWFHVTDPKTMRMVHTGILINMFLFAVGFCSRITGFITWAAMLSYIHRGQTSLFGMDTITNLVSLYLCIGPSGAAFSVDRLLQRYWSAYRAIRNNRPIPAFSPPAPSVSANLAIRLMQVNLCLIYGVSGMSKLLGPLWWGGTAVWMTMANYEFSPMNSVFYMTLLRFLARHRWLWELVVTGGTFFTLAFEISFPYLIWNSRLRSTMIFSAVVMHLGIALCMGLVTFSLMMLVMLLSMVPAETIRQAFWRLGRGEVGLRLAQLEG